MNGNGCHTALDLARDYHRRGLAPIPVPYRRKGIETKGWQNLRYSESDLPNAFVGRSNIGILNGEPSGWVVDVDLDDPLAVELADEFLPPTQSEFGRAGKPRSHRLYRLTEPCNTHQRRMPKGADGKAPMIVELRSTGTQTIFPGSVRGAQEDGERDEPIEWHVDGEPASIDPATLLTSVDNLADEVLRRKEIDPAEAKRPARQRSINGSTHHSGRQSIKDRARKYVAKIPPAISGSGGHDQTYTVACALVLGFDLSTSDAMECMREYNQRCEPEWSERELLHKVEDADKEAGERGYLLNGQAHESNGRHDDGYTVATEGKAEVAPSLWSAEGRTDASNARRIARRRRGDIRWCDRWGKWLIWDGTRWKPDDELWIDAFAKEDMSALWPEAVEVAQKAENKQTINDVFRFAKSSNSNVGVRNAIALARSEPGIPICPEVLDQDPMLLNLLNGTLDLRTGTLRQHDRADHITKIANVKFDAAADCPTWRGFVNRIMDGNAKLVAFLRRCCGLSLTGLTTEHVLLVLYGVGANGKSTFLNTLCWLLGDDYSMKAPPDLLMVRKGETHPTERADLCGKRLVCCIESEDGRRLSEALAKELTGGDLIRARRMKEDFWQFAPTHKIWLASNHRPVVRGTDHGIWRRIMLIMFGVIIPDAEQDRDLPEKLKAEASGILNWCLIGLSDWQATGLQVPAEVRAATSDYKRDMDVIGQFIDEQCTLSPAHEAFAKELYAAYKKWCEENNEYILTQRRFGDHLTERGIGSRKGTGGYMVRTGIALRIDAGGTGEFADDAKEF
jgi:putative DNA primase/helicase